jgi:transcription elongation factor GreB
VKRSPEAARPSTTISQASSEPPGAMSATVRRFSRAPSKTMVSCGSQSSVAPSASRSAMSMAQCSVRAGGAVDLLGRLGRRDRRRARLELDGHGEAIPVGDAARGGDQHRKRRVARLGWGTISGMGRVDRDRPALSARPAGEDPRGSGRGALHARKGGGVHRLRDRLRTEMSKAFTKESDGDDEDDLPEESGGLAITAKNYMTPEGFARMREELDTFLRKERPEVVKVVSWAAGNGDRSENGDYIYGKKRLREIDRRVRYLSKRLANAEVVDSAKRGKTDQVFFGATVTTVNEKGEERTVKIVGVDEVDLARGHVSWISPIAKALLRAEEGDVVKMRTPAGVEELEIVSKWNIGRSRKAKCNHGPLPWIGIRTGTWADLLRMWSDYRAKALHGR